jgi:hypothetical protein
MKMLRMPLLIRRTTITTALLLGTIGAAQAETVFDQGPVQPAGGVRSVFWNADDFILPTSASLSGATFNLGYDVRPGFAPAPEINYELYTDNAGTPGAIFQSGTATARVTDLGLNNDSTYRFNAWAFDFSAAVQALAGVRYWIGVQQPADVALANTPGTNPGAPAMIRLGTYVPRDPGLAFSLQGTASGPAGAVPEPATWAMMILGFGAIGGSMRRRIRTSVRFA